MSFLSVLGGILGLVPKGVEAVESISKAARKSRDTRRWKWDRGHFYDSLSVECIYCKRADRQRRKITDPPCPGP